MDASSGGPIVVDQLLFGYQGCDWSIGRYPDGGTSWQDFWVPTPGEENADPATQ